MKERNVNMKKRQHLTGEKVKIDYAMLTLLAAKKGLSPSELSHMIGQTHSWLSARHHEYGDMIPVAAAVLIEEKAGIRKEDFLAKTEPAEEPACQKTLFDHEPFGGKKVTVNWGQAFRTYKKQTSLPSHSEKRNRARRRISKTATKPFWRCVRANPILGK